MRLKRPSFFYIFICIFTSMNVKNEIGMKMKIGTIAVSEKAERLVIANSIGNSENRLVVQGPKNLTAERHIQPSTKEFIMKTKCFLSLAFFAVVLTFFACSSDSDSPNPGPSLCAGEGYDPDIFRCETGELIGKCAGQDYYPAHQQCNNGVVENKNPSSSSNIQLSSSSRKGYCNYGPGECYPMDTEEDVANCTAWGQVVNSCPAIYGYCNYGPGQCYQMYTEEDVANCPATVVISCSTTPSSSSTTPNTSSSSSAPKCGTLNYNPSTQICYYDKIYNYVTIGTQIWMKENLNYNATNSKCYDDLESNCNTYGRLYDWATAMNIASTYNSNSYTTNGKHRGICPDGWHIPSVEEWAILTGYVATQGGCTGCAGTRLKANSSLWETNTGTDNHGFSALPGGASFGGYGSFNSVGNQGFWWSSTESTISNSYANSNANSRNMGANYGDVGDGMGNSKLELFSVRCVRD